MDARAAPLPAWQRELLDERLAELERSPDAGSSWDDVERRADLRLSGLWLEAAGLLVGQEYEVEVDGGRLVIVAV